MISNQSLLDRRLQAVPRGVATATPVFANHATDTEIWDVEGKRYIDFAGGIAVLNVGHRHPKIIAAVEQQLARFTHTSFQVMGYESYVALAERLNILAPFSAPAKSIFFTTGAEATENAVKIARAATGRASVVAFTGGFHGRTMLAASMTGKVLPYKRDFGPAVPEVYHIPFPCEHKGVSADDALRALEFLFAATVPAERVAAIIIEPVQGEGGFNVAPFGFLAALREICDDHGILLIADEVQTGFGRTGKMFGIEHSGIEPDMIAVAKSLAGGFPLSGVVGKADILETVEPGGLGGTYGGNPLACAAALAVLDVLDEEDLLARSVAIGERIKVRVAGWQNRNDLIPAVNLRGLGAMVAFDIYADADNGPARPDGAGAKAVCARAIEAGLVLLSCGTSGETIRILVPLTASDAVVDEGLDILETALSVPSA